MQHLGFFQIGVHNRCGKIRQSQRGKGYANAVAFTTNTFGHNPFANGATNRANCIPIKKNAIVPSNVPQFENNQKEYENCMEIAKMNFAFSV